MGKLDGKVAIVTGGGGWLGCGIVLALAKEGAKVAIADINEKAAASVAEQVRKLGGDSLAAPCDVADNDQVKRMVGEVAGQLGPPRILVNAAQSWDMATPTHEGWSTIESVTEQQWDAFYQSGMKSTLYCCRAVLPYMKDGGGKIVNFGSITGLEGWEGTADYNVTKEAVRGFSRTAAREWGKYKINVNVICPSALTPSKIEAAFGRDSQQAKGRRKFIEDWTAKLPLRRVGDPERDIGRAVVFLASEDSDFITGQTLNVDGGAHMPS